MLIAPSLDEYVGTGLAASQLARELLLLDEGDIGEQYIVAAAAMATAVTQYGTRLSRQTYLEGCGDDRAVLVQRVMDRWNLPPLEEAAAVVTVTFSRASAAAGAGGIAAGTVVATLIDSEGIRQEFATDALVSYGALETGSKSVSATASVPGAAGNVAAGTLTEKVTALFDSSITVTNAARAAGGADEESNTDYIARARQYPSTLAKGTAGAVELRALSVAGIRIATASENEDTGIATLYIADGAGGSNAELVLRVIDALEDTRALGSAVQVTGGTLLEVDVAYTLTMKFGSAADVAGVVGDAITDEMAKLGGGETLYLARIVAAIINAAPDRIRNAVITDPVNDIVPEPNEIIRAGAITGT